ncbi:AlpA family transcriptional regulator [Polaromonas sp.]|uniref:helix-turn-helix transcriptional regulator n=1 Tax=Polaromonas sp. TaxID=1869339 RepID=UPI00185E96A7|nr:AlpA family phage regulatory protein [Polaromonas sp.]NML87284.1 AlpA family phage regulatory protein [Polaromonas sp.]
MQHPFDALPNSAHIRQTDLLQSPRSPAAPVPFSHSTLWRKVKDGTCPAPVKLSARVTAWQVGAVRQWLESMTEANTLPQKAHGKAA